MIFETERSILRPWQESDADDYIDMQECGSNGDVP